MCTLYEVPALGNTIPQNIAKGFRKLTLRRDSQRDRKISHTEPLCASRMAWEACQQSTLGSSISAKIFDLRSWQEWRKLDPIGRAAIAVLLPNENCCALE